MKYINQESFVKIYIGSQKFPSNDNVSLKNVLTDIKNPKILNMLPAYEKAQYSFILISDSGLMMHENTLYDMVMLMTDNVGLVHQMPFTCDRKGFAASVEKVCYCFIYSSQITISQWSNNKNTIDKYVH